MEGENLKIALKEVGKLIKDKLKQGAKDDEFVASGKLDKSFKYRVIANELYIYGEEYAGALSDGVKRDAGYNKVGEEFTNSIIRWAKIKGMRPLRRSKSGQFTSLKEYSYKSMAIAIAKSIRRKGISQRFGYKGSGFIDTVKKDMQEQIKTILKAGYKKDIMQQLDELKTIK